MFIVGDVVTAPMCPGYTYVVERVRSEDSIDIRCKESRTLFDRYSPSSFKILHPARINIRSIFRDITNGDAHV